MKELPKYFVIKRDANNPLWKKYIDWMNYKFSLDWYGTINNYYGYDGNPLCNGCDTWNQLDSFEHNPTLITLKEWDECINGFKLPEKWCVKDCEEVNRWALEQFKYSCNIFYDHIYLYIDQSKFPHNSCYRFVSIAYGKDHGYTEITFEQFQEHVLISQKKLLSLPGLN